MTTRGCGSSNDHQPTSGPAKIKTTIFLTWFQWLKNLHHHYQGQRWALALLTCWKAEGRKHDVHNNNQDKCFKAQTQSLNLIPTNVYYLIWSMLSPVSLVKRCRMCYDPAAVRFGPRCDGDALLAGVDLVSEKLTDWGFLIQPQLLYTSTLLSVLWGDILLCCWVWQHLWEK